VRSDYDLLRLVKLTVDDDESVMGVESDRHNGIDFDPRGGGGSGWRSRKPRRVIRTGQWEDPRMTGRRQSERTVESRETPCSEPRKSCSSKDKDISSAENS